MVNTLLDKWKELNKYNITLYNLLNYLNCKRVVIFGKRDISTTLYNSLKENNNNIIYTENIDDINNGDCVIISYFEEYYSIERLMPENILLLSIRELIELTHYIYVYAPKIAKLNEKCKKYLIRIPKIETEIKSRNIYESLVNTTRFDIKKYQNNPPFFKFLYNDIKEYSSQYIKNVFQEVPIIQKIWGGEVGFIDFRSEYVNIINGERFTINQPEKYNSRIYMFGSCDVYGMGTDDSRTMASCIQKYYKNTKVINYGLYGEATDAIKNKPFFYQYYDDDVILFFNSNAYLPLKTKPQVYNFVKTNLEKLGIEYCDTYNIYDKRNDDKPIFVDDVHINHRGYKLIADYLYENYLKKLDLDNKKTNNNKSVSRQLSNNDYKGLENYINYIKQSQFHYDSNKKYGAIVMNVNPCTNGHLYLIENALKEVDYLYIFLVEENKSTFSFDERLYMLSKSIEQYKNIKILKSGNYIISTITFPEYFTKDFQKEAVIDTSLDINIFAEKIAPALHISTRFAGEEPFCNITRQYNKTMQEILPQYNITFKEIKRYEINGIPVSATKVRECIKNKDKDTLKQLVPNVVYDNLIKKYW